MGKGDPNQSVIIAERVGDLKGVIEWAVEAGQPISNPL